MYLVGNTSTIRVRAIKLGCPYTRCTRYNRSHAPWLRGVLSPRRPNSHLTETVPTGSPITNRRYTLRTPSLAWSPTRVVSLSDSYLPRACTPKIVPPVGHMSRVRNLEYDVYSSFLGRPSAHASAALRHICATCTPKRGLAAPPRCPACTFSVVLVGFCVF